MQGKNNGERKNRVKKIEDIICSLISHFWSTSRSSFSTCYIPFQISGSQESNALNGVQFGVEMKELQPLQADHSKLKEEFCTALRNHPFVARWFRSLFVQCCVSPLKFPVTMEAEYHKLKDHFAALRNQLFAVKWFHSPFCASAKSRRPRLHLRNDP